MFIPIMLPEPRIAPKLHPRLPTPLDRTPGMGEILHMIRPRIEATAMHVAILGVIPAMLVFCGLRVEGLVAVVAFDGLAGDVDGASWCVVDGDVAAAGGVEVDFAGVVEESSG